MSRIVETKGGMCKLQLGPDKWFADGAEISVEEAQLRCFSGNYDARCPIADTLECPPQRAGTGPAPTRRKNTAAEGGATETKDSTGAESGATEGKE